MTPPSSPREHPAACVVRHDLRPGDLGSVVRLHGVVYAQEHGFDLTFEAYVAGPLADFVRSRTDRDRLWVAEREGECVGSVAVVRASEREAQLRWYLVEPSARGVGLGTRLLEEALAFGRSRGFDSMFLWTVRALAAAGRLYGQAGFVLVEERPDRLWGVEVVEEKYVLQLR